MAETMALGETGESEVTANSAGLPVYAKMKDSGVEWLGRVPAHWSVERLKRSLRNVVEPTGERPKFGAVIALENVESWTGRVTHMDPETPFDSQLKRFRAGDVLFGKLRPYLAKVARRPTGGLCVGEFFVLRPRRKTVEGAYFEHLLRSKPVISAVAASTFGARMPRANWQFMGAMHVVRPPLPEQTAIVRYLDHMDPRIRRAIREREKLLELFEEQKQAAIEQAVTGGIDVRTGQPYPAYQDSGVDWLGRLPAHWRRRKLRQCAAILGGVTPSMDVRRFWGAEIPWVTPKDMKAAVVTRSQMSVTDEAVSETSLRLIPAPAVLMVVRGMVLARKVPVARTTAPVTINQDMKALISDPEISADYLAAYLACAHNGLFPLIDEAGHGTRRLPTERWRELTTAVPPLPEQSAITRYVDRVTADTAAAKDRADRQIALLREYRVRLIADVVTGKVDVREAATNLPEVDPLDTVSSCEATARSA